MSTFTSLSCPVSHGMQMLTKLLALSVCLAVSRVLAGSSAALHADALLNKFSHPGFQALGLRLKTAISEQPQRCLNGASVLIGNLQTTAPSAVVCCAAWGCPLSRTMCLCRL